MRNHLAAASTCLLGCVACIEGLGKALARHVNITQGITSPTSSLSVPDEGGVMDEVHDMYVQLQQCKIRIDAALPEYAV